MHDDTDIPQAEDHRGAWLNAALEAAGFVCLVAFAYVVWAPAALGATGIILVLVGNARAVRTRPSAQAKAPFLERLGAAIAAYQAGAARGRGRP